MAVGRVVNGLRGLTKNSLERGEVIHSHLRPPVKPRLGALDDQGQLVAARPTCSVTKASNSIAEAT